MSADRLLQLPGDVVSALVRDWLTVPDLCLGLDCAFTSRRLRGDLLRHYSSFTGPIITQLIIINKDMYGPESLAWLKKRGASAESFRFEASVTAAHISNVTPKMMRNMRSLEFAVPTVHPMDISCIASCNWITSLYLSERRGTRSCLGDAELALIFTHCPRIEVLSLLFICGLSNSIFQVIGENLQGLRDLSVLNGTRFKLASVFEDVLVHMPSSLTSLRLTATVKGGAFDAQRAERSPPACAPCLRLVEGDLTVCLEVCLACPNVRHLMLDGGETTQYDASLAHLLSVHIAEVEDMHLRGDLANCADLGASCLALTHLTCTPTKSSLDIASWAHAFRAQHCLTSVVLHGIREDSDADEMVEALCRHNLQLRRLELHGYFLVAAPALLGLPHLEALQLPGAVSLEYVNEAVRRLPGLRELKLQHAHFPDSTVECILRDLRNLRLLDISGCQGCTCDGVTEAVVQWGAGLRSLHAGGVISRPEAMQRILLSCPALDDFLVLYPGDTHDATTYDMVMRAVRVQFPRRVVNLFVGEGLE